VKFDQARIDKLSSALGQVCPADRLRLISFDTFSGPFDLQSTSGPPAPGQ